MVDALLAYIKASSRQQRKQPNKLETRHRKLDMVSLASSSLAKVVSLVLALASVEVHGFDNSRNDNVCALFNVQ